MIQLGKFVVGWVGLLVVDTNYLYPARWGWINYENDGGMDFFVVMPMEIDKCWITCNMNFCQLNLRLDKIPRQNIMKLFLNKNVI